MYEDEDEWDRQTNEDEMYRMMDEEDELYMEDWWIDGGTNKEPQQSNSQKSELSNNGGCAGVFILLAVPVLIVVFSCF